MSNERRGLLFIVSAPSGTACHEIGEFASYDYVVVNDTLDLSVERLRGIVLAERARVGRMRAQAEAIIATFPQACTE